MPTNPTTPELLSEREIAEIEATNEAHRIDWRYPNQKKRVRALCQTLRAVREQLQEEQRRNQTQADTIMEYEGDVAALRERLAQMRETLTSCDSVLSYVYHRERSRLLPETQQQLSDTMREVERITRRKP